MADYNCRVCGYDASPVYGSRAPNGYLCHDCAGKIARTFAMALGADSPPWDRDGASFTFQEMEDFLARMDYDFVRAVSRVELVLTDRQRAGV